MDKAIVTTLLVGGVSVSRASLRSAGFSPCPGPRAKTRTRKLRHYLLVVMLVILPGCSREASLHEFQGEWSVLEYNDDGKLADTNKLTKVSVKVEGIQLRTIIAGEVGDEYTITVNRSKSPAEIDLTYANGDLQGRAVFGIYALEDRKLKICAGAVRPVDFNVQAGAGHVLWVLERK